MTSPLTDALAWLVIGLLTGSVLLASRNRRIARYPGASAWVLFAVFWAVLTPHFAFEQKSIIEGIGAAVAVPASLYVGYLLVTGRDSLFTLSRAVALMGLVYLPFITVQPMARLLIEAATAQSYFIIESLGYSPTLVRGEAGYSNSFLFVGPTGHRYVLHVILACTGIGSMSIMTGVIGAAEAPLRRRVQAIMLVIPIIWVLNLLRVTFISLAHGKQWFRLQPLVDPVLFLFGSTDVHRVSYFVSDRLIAQSLSVVALLALIWAVARVVPEILAVVEEVLVVFTSREFDLEESFDGA